jgi:6,7-dimethyl-8-ribityllumazine synthase
MASALGTPSSYQPLSPEAHASRRVAVLVSNWHPELTSVLARGAVDTCKGAGVGQVDVFSVPGSFELPLATRWALADAGYHGAIAIGIIIKGDTRHDEFIAHAVSKGLTDVSLQQNKPVAFGVLTTENLEQAQDRSGGKIGNKGVEAAVALLHMLELAAKLGARAAI